MYIFSTLDVTNFFFKAVWIFLPNNGITLRLIANASNGPSHNVIGIFQLINSSNGIIFLDTSGFLYFRDEFLSKLLAVK